MVIFRLRRKPCAPIAQRLEQRFRKPSEVEWQQFREYLVNKHRRTWACELYRLAVQYHDLDTNLSMLDSFSRSKKAKVLQSLIALAKFMGYYEDFRASLKSHGVKWQKPSSLEAFMRIRNNSNSNVLEWLRQASQVLGEDSTLTEFILVSGLRVSEAIESFNLIVKLSHEGKLEEYYNESLSTLEHFAFPKLFLRRTKNVYVSIVSPSMVERISQHTPVTYDSVKMKLQRKHMNLRLDELRDYYGSFMVQHGNLIREEVDLLQGRIGESIFTRHYFSPSFRELRDRTLRAVEKLKAQA
jgi:intergrase/recombinase